MRLVGWLSVVALGSLAGCFEETPEQRARAVCNAYCECLVSAGEVEQCVVESCLPEIPPVTDACLDCVVQNSQMCGALEAQCTDVCIDDGDMP